MNEIPVRFVNRLFRTEPSRSTTSQCVELAPSRDSSLEGLLSELSLLLRLLSSVVFRFVPCSVVIIVVLLIMDCDD